MNDFMVVDAGFDRTKLRFLSVRFHYIYCFALNEAGAGASKMRDAMINASFVAGFPLSRKGWLPSIKAETLLSSAGFKFLDCHTKDDFADAEYTEEKELNEQFFGPPIGLVRAADNFSATSLKVKICPLIRFRNNGIGTFTLTVDASPSSPNERIFLEQLEPFIRLVPRTWVQLEKDRTALSDNDQSAPYLTAFRGLFNNPDKPVTLDELFARSVEHVIQRLGKTVPIGPLFSEMLTKAEDWRGRFRKIQVPYLCYDALIDRGEYDRLFLDDANRGLDSRTVPTSITKQLSALLLRYFNLDAHSTISQDFIREEFCTNSNGNPRISTMNSNSQLFSYAHRTAALVICHSRSELPADFVIPSILDMLETLRLRKHMLTIGNLMLDEYLGELSGSDITDERLNTMILSAEELRGDLARCISDPMTFLHDGHVGFDLFDIAKQRFGIPFLESGLSSKLDFFVRMWKTQPIRRALRTNLVHDHDPVSGESSDINKALDDMDWGN